MSEMKKETKTALWIILGIFIFILLCVGAWFMFFRIACDWKIVASLAGQAAQKYADPVAAEKVITAGINDLKHDSQKMKQAAEYAKANNIAIERVIVDSAVAYAKQMKFLA